MNSIIEQSALHGTMTMYSYYVIALLCIGLYKAVINNDTEALRFWNTQWQLAFVYWIAYTMKGV